MSSSLYCSLPLTCRIILPGITNLSSTGITKTRNKEISTPGVGVAGTRILGPRRMHEAIARAHEQESPGKITIRWKSAMPVRAVETRLKY
jgi:hypothetical protein